MSMASNDYDAMSKSNSAQYESNTYHICMYTQLVFLPNTFSSISNYQVYYFHKNKIS